MSILKQLFKKKDINLPSQGTTRTLDLLKEQKGNLSKGIHETLKFYNDLSCPCAFPRFRQYASIDCIDYKGVFFMNETEALIYHCQSFFDIQEIDVPEMERGSINYKATYTCKKCRSQYDFGWGQFSINLDRCYLKMLKLNADPIGAPPEQPIRFYIGPMGHRLPDKKLFQQVSLPELIKYLREIDEIGSR